MYFSNEKSHAIRLTIYSDSYSRMHGININFNIVIVPRLLWQLSPYQTQCQWMWWSWNSVHGLHLIFVCSTTTTAAIIAVALSDFDGWVRRNTLARYVYMRDMSGPGRVTFIVQQFPRLIFSVLFFATIHLFTRNENEVKQPKSYKIYTEDGEEEERDVAQGKSHGAGINTQMTLMMLCRVRGIWFLSSLFLKEQ